MKTNKTHISLETGKLLKDCGVESKMAYIKEDSEYIAVNIEHWEVVDGEWGDCRDIVFKETEDSFEIQGFYAYTWQEILWENAKKFFSYEDLQIGHWSRCETVQNQDGTISLGKVVAQGARDKSITTEILDLLQQNKYEEADEYFRKVCVLIK